MVFITTVLHMLDQIDLIISIAAGRTGVFPIVCGNVCNAFDGTWGTFFESLLLFSECIYPLAEFWVNFGGPLIVKRKTHSIFFFNSSVLPAYAKWVVSRYDFNILLATKSFEQNTLVFSHCHS